MKKYLNQKSILIKNNLLIIKYLVYNGNLAFIKLSKNPCFAILDQDICKNLRRIADQVFLCR